MFRSAPWLKGLVPLALFMILGVFLAGGLQRDPSQLPSQMIDRPLPDFSMQTLDGDPIHQTDIVGEVTLLNVFGSWCAACLVEHPLLMRVGEDDSVKLIGVNWRDQPDRAKAWLRQHGDPYDQIVADPDSRLIIDLGVVGAPETFVLDPNGRIRYKHTGPISPEDWQTVFVPLINALRDESASEAGRAAL